MLTETNRNDGQAALLMRWRRGADRLRAAPVRAYSSAYIGIIIEGQSPRRFGHPAPDASTSPGGGHGSVDGDDE